MGRRKRRPGWFSWSMDLTFYKVVTNLISDSGTIVPRGDAGSCEPLAIAFHQLINSQPCCICVSASRPLIWCTLLIHQHWTRGQQQRNSGLKDSYPTHTFFLPKVQQSPPEPRNTDSTSILPLRTISTVKPPTKNTEMRKTWHQIDHKKDTCLQHETRNKEAESRLAWPSPATCVPSESSFSPLWVGPWMRKCRKSWFGVARKF